MSAEDLSYGPEGPPVKTRWPKGLKHGEIYERFEDMSPDGRLQVVIDSDGDVCIGIVPSSDEVRHFAPSVEFCTVSVGGGNSPRVRQALLDLAEAIMLDNQYVSQSAKRKRAGLQQ
jgi:hypothetical protein